MSTKELLEKLGIELQDDEIITDETIAELSNGSEKEDQDEQ